jgi:hypothetical protein
MWLVYSSFSKSTRNIIRYGIGYYKTLLNENRWSLPGSMGSKSVWRDEYGLWTEVENESRNKESWSVRSLES